MRLVKFALRLALLGLALVGILAVYDRLRGRGWLGEAATTEQAIVLKQVTTLGKLELVRFTFKDIVEHEQARPLLPNAKAVLIVEGEATGCIDLTRLTAADLTPGQNDTLVVRLPQPELCGWRINHQRSRVYDTEYTFLNGDQLVSDAYRQAEAQIKQAALNGGILNQTRQNAERILRPVLERVSGKAVILTYQPPATTLKPLR